MILPLVYLIAATDVCSVAELDTVYSGKCSYFKNGQSAAINPKAQVYYVACRWNYKALGRQWHLRKRADIKDKLSKCCVYVCNIKTGRVVCASPADWGPATWTGRGIDCSKALISSLEAKTDDVLYWTLSELDTSISTVTNLIETARIMNTLPDSTRQD